MSESLREALKPSSSYSLANAFSRLGWTGFWAQIAIGSIPFVLAIYSFLFDSGGGAGTRSGLALVQDLTISSLLLMAFTTLWFFPYTPPSNQNPHPKRHPQLS